MTGFQEWSKNNSRDNSGKRKPSRSRDKRSSGTDRKRSFNNNRGRSSENNRGRSSGNTSGGNSRNNSGRNSGNNRGRNPRVSANSIPVSFPQGINEISKFPRVYSDRKGKNTKLLVESVDGKTYFEESTFRKQGLIYREVNPERSKLFAAIYLGISQIGFQKDSKVLYLGASHGYTVSFLADMIVDGEIYALDFAPRVVRDLVFLCEDKTNMAPLMADANKPESYKEFVPQVDVVFMDISQRNQTEIFIKNCDEFLKQGGFGLLALKARSVDVTKKPKDIFIKVRDELENNPDYSIVDYKELSPLEQDHAMFVVKKK